MLITVAQEEMRRGAGEIGGNNRGPFVERYLKPAGLAAPLPWCAAFVSWCIHEAARHLSVPPPLPYLVSAKGIFRFGKSRGWLVHDPGRGDLVVWSRGAPTGPFGHVGIVELYKGGELVTIEGNRAPTVANFRYIISEMRRLLGFVRLPSSVFPASRSQGMGGRVRGKA